MRFLILSLLILSTAAFGGTRVTPNVGTNMSILTSNNTSYLSGSTLWKQGDTATSYIERLGRHTPVGVTPSRGVSLARIGSAAKDLIRLSPTSVAASVGLMAIIEAAGWAIDELTGQITAPDYIIQPYDSSYYHWKLNQQGTGPGFGTASEAAEYYASSTAASCCTQQAGSGSFISDTVYEFDLIITRKDNGSISHRDSRVFRHGRNCASGYSYDNSVGACAVSGKKPVTSSDIDSLQISGDASFYDGLMRDACNLSASPSRCFDSLVEQRRLSGPATVEGPKTTTTSTQTNADGSTSTVEKETRTQYDIEYGDDHYVYTPKTTTETKVDGQTTETTTEQEDTAEDSEQKPEEEPVSEIAGLNCEASIACSGDAIQCAIASTQKDTKCLLQDALDFPAQQSEVNTLFAGDAFTLDEEEIEIPSFIGQGTRFLPSTCPAPISIPLSFRTYQIDLEPMCFFASEVGNFLVVLAALGAAMYVGRAFGGD